jgi:hypothetical protein
MTIAFPLKGFLSAVEFLYKPGDLLPQGLRTLDTLFIFFHLSLLCAFPPVFNALARMGK